jgi:hypothetical protein
MEGIWDWNLGVDLTTLWKVLRAAFVDTIALALALMNLLILTLAWLKTSALAVSSCDRKFRSPRLVGDIVRTAQAKVRTVRQSHTFGIAT